MSRTSRALKGTAIQQAFELLAMALSLVLVPLYLLKLGQEGYGLYLTAVAWAGYLLFSNGGLSAATLILVSQASGGSDPTAIARIVSTSRTLSLFTGLIVALLSVGLFLLLRMPQVAVATRLTHPDAPLLALMVGAQVVISLSFSPFFDLLFGLQRAPEAAFIQGASRLLTQLLALLFLFLELPVWAVFAATPLSFAAAGLGAYVLIRRSAPSTLSAGYSWDREQVRAQLRTGAKSLGLQVGSTLSSTAPIFVLTAVGGPALVPLYAVPLRIITVASSMLFAFVAMLQGAVGEAWAKRDLSWLVDNTRALLRNGALLLAGIAGVMVAIGPATVHVWTRGRLNVDLLMIGGAVCAASVLAVTSSLRFILSAMNRHREAAIAELACGALSFAACAAAASLSPGAVGFGFAAAALATTLWVMPRELRRYFETDRLFPTPAQLASIGAMFAATWATTSLASLAVQRAGAAVSWTVVAAGLVGGLTFAVGCQLFGAIDFIGRLRQKSVQSQPE